MKAHVRKAALNAGYEAARAWYADLLDRIEAHENETGLSGYCVDPRLKAAFKALPAGQGDSFLDAVGAYLMTFRVIGQPTKTYLLDSDRLAMFASTPAEQDAWGGRSNGEEDLA